MRPYFSRRDFLKYTGALAGAGILSACGPGAAAPPPPAQACPSTPTPYPWARPPLTPTPSPSDVPPPTRVSTRFDVCAFYCQFRDYPGGQSGLVRSAPGYEMIVPLYGDHQDPYTMRMDCKWALEHGVGTFIMGFGGKYERSVGDQRIDNWLLPASEPPFGINFALMFNPEFELLDTSDPLAPSAIYRHAQDSIAFLARAIQHPRYKRLPDGRPVVFYYLAKAVAFWYGTDTLQQTADVLRSQIAADIFLVGDITAEMENVVGNPKYAGDYIARELKSFDGITSYYMPGAGSGNPIQKDEKHLVTYFKDMILGYDQALDFWAEKASKYGIKLLPAPTPTGFSNRLLYEGGLDPDVVDRHDGVSYETSKEMVELAVKYADPELKMVVMACWNELSEGAAIVPSVVFKFDPIHAVRDTFAVKPAGGWPKDYYPLNSP